jgi:hypothetical protein
MYSHIKFPNLNFMLQCYNYKYNSYIYLDVNPTCFYIMHVTLARNNLNIIIYVLDGF